jgi:hypothetical protein
MTSRFNTLAIGLAAGFLLGASVTAGASGKFYRHADLLRPIRG